MLRRLLLTFLYLASTVGAATPQDIQNLWQLWTSMVYWQFYQDLFRGLPKDTTVTSAQDNADFTQRDRSPHRTDQQLLVNPPTTERSLVAQSRCSDSSMTRRSRPIPPLSWCFPKSTTQGSNPVAASTGKATVTSTKTREIPLITFRRNYIVKSILQKCFGPITKGLETFCRYVTIYCYNFCRANNGLHRNGQIKNPEVLNQFVEKMFNKKIEILDLTGFQYREDALMNVLKRLESQEYQISGLKFGDGAKIFLSTNLKLPGIRDLIIHDTTEPFFTCVKRMADLERLSLRNNVRVSFKISEVAHLKEVDLRGSTNIVIMYDIIEGTSYENSPDLPYLILGCKEGLAVRMRSTRENLIRAASMGLIIAPGL